MSSQVPTEKAPRAPPVSVNLPAKSAGFQRSGFVSRYKLQQQRIRALNQMDNSSESKKRVQKSLPKIENSPDKENLVIRAVHRSNTIDLIKLPGVKGNNPPPPPLPPPAQKRKTLPMKTYHLRVNPDHTSFISKSLPSLPSIPGSPSYPEEHAVSPLTERTTDKEKVPIFSSKHRFEKIVFQKHIHGDGADPGTSQPSKVATGRPQPLVKTTHGPPLPPGIQSARALEKPHTSGSVRIRYSKAPSEVVISETQSEPSFEINRKWKENCRCLRCQMLKRQFREGDSHYALWGRYPCHNLDPSIMLDD